MKHKNLRWNPATLEWFCLTCGRTSDHISELDARVELELFECDVPWVHTPTIVLDESGNR